ncbi:Phosphate-import ATP-binding protein PhnC [Pelagimonas phthalicica]|uniref:Phosphate-import ATP-binding protein PhnC n=1 Tax=Pelagimonas phthalicica TaxID=1037362 RepID=A0A238JBY3_9RHOB|nr:ATP-binding cassette domain-containing protein [Pelagimonas phthalicica]TDS93809.1 phosphonate transport system ATP-binding protein [Pelagimonas phthalicica]SMX27667.1 Phosphate-import ATP-binding protein PhnC [Pelagimonas phthalicica]
MTDLLDKQTAQERSTGTGAGFAPVLPVDIRACALSKSFGDTLIFSDVSFGLSRGEAVAIVGSNGTGKSTLLRCIMGLIAADSGQVEMLGTNVSAARPAELRKLRAQVGLVSQKHNLVPRLSVLSNVVHGLLGQHPGLRHWSQALAPTGSREAAMEALGKVGLADLANRRADRLSGGQSQRVAIARALVGQPKILFADEPTASLDPAAGEDVMDLFFSLARKQGVTVVFISHHMSHALTYGDRVLGLAGKKLRLDTRADHLNEAELRELYD